MRMRSRYPILAVSACAAVAAGVLMTPAGDSVAPVVVAQSINCDLSQYKAVSGLTAAMESGAVAVTWSGSNGSELRSSYAVQNGQPVIRELAVRKTGGQWAPLGQNLVPEFYVKSGLRHRLNRR
jgi:hypothetical protein